DDRGTEVSVYRALSPLICSRCESNITEGDLFTRRKLARIRISPFCQECIPFKTVQTGSSSTPLIEFLLKPEQETNKAAWRRAIAAKVFISPYLETNM
ncbi:MAG TPA: hypothetical protein VF717_00710, partial [Pyrinomonadaceae bacterium]